MWVADEVIFAPPKPTAFTQDEFTHFFKTEDHETVYAVYHPVEQQRFVVLYSHGNAVDLANSPYWIDMLNKNGYGAFVYDYPGYGLSSGQPSENNTYQAVEAAYQYLTQKLNIAPEHIIVFGRSLGCAPSIYLATKHKVAKLIIEAPFLSAFTVMTHKKIFPIDRFPNHELIHKVKVPTLVIHGTKDTVIPFKHGERIFELANEPKQFYPVESAGHNDVIVTAGEAYWQTIKDFVGE